MKELKRIIIALAGIVVCVFLFDFGVGRLFDYLLKQLPSEGERVAKSNYVLTQVHSDIVIIGSSRAECHYDTSVIQDSFPAKTVFNCGIDGALFFYEVVVLNSILDRYTPELIVWDLQNNELSETEQSENLGLLYPYYWKNDYIRQFLDKQEPELKYMIWLNSYRFNATGSRMLRPWRHPATNRMGYGGKKSSDASRIIEKKTIIQEAHPLDPIKIEMFKDALIRVREQGSKIVIVQSPYFNEFDRESETTSIVKRICTENNIQFIDGIQLPQFIGNQEYIYDAGHLNWDGARLFTNIFLSQLDYTSNKSED